MSSPVATIAGRPRSRGYIGGAGTRYRPSRDLTESVLASVVIIPGRGESTGQFEHIAFRLALGGYEVTLLAPGEGTVAVLGETRVPGVPFVAMGSDTGALRALILAGSPALRLDALVLLGLPLLYRPVAGQVPTDAPPRALPDLPIFLIHGRDDEVSPLPLVQMTTRTAPRAHLEIVAGGHHVLAGPGGGCITAQTLLFLEAVRAGHGRQPAGAMSMI